MKKVTQTHRQTYKPLAMILIVNGPTTLAYVACLQMLHGVHSSFTAIRITETV